MGSEWRVNGGITGLNWGCNWHRLFWFNYWNYTQCPTLNWLYKGSTHPASVHVFLVFFVLPKCIITKSCRPHLIMDCCMDQLHIWQLHSSWTSKLNNFLSYPTESHSLTDYFRSVCSLPHITFIHSKYHHWNPSPGSLNIGSCSGESPLFPMKVVPYAAMSIMFQKIWALIQYKDVVLPV